MARSGSSASGRTARAGADAFGIEFEIEAYLEMHARKFVGTFDANCYLYLSRSWTSSTWRTTAVRSRRAWPA